LKILRTILHIVDNTNKWVGKVVSFFILIIIVAIIWDVVLRYRFDAAPVWGMGSYGKLFLFYIVFGAPFALLTHSHVNVDIVYHRFPPRVKGIVDVVTSFLFFIFCLVLLHETLPPVLAQLQYLRFTPSMLLPTKWPLLLMIPIGLILFLLQGLAKFTRDLLLAITGRETA